MSERITEWLIEMAYGWGDIEDDLTKHADPTAIGGFLANEEELLVDALKEAFRVEAHHEEILVDISLSRYVVLFDVSDKSSREAAQYLRSHLQQLTEWVEMTVRTWDKSDEVIVRVVPRSTPVEGQICRRRGERHPAQITPGLADVPTFKPSGGAVDLEQRGLANAHRGTVLRRAVRDRPHVLGAAVGANRGREIPRGLHRLPRRHCRCGG
jgi:hypothetical protein